MKGKIQTTGSIKLETGEEHWTLLVRGLVNELRISGIIEIEPERQVRIQILVKEIYSPEQIQSRSVCITTGNFDATASNGINRINEHLFNFLDSKKWIIIGETQGEINIPVILVHYCLINMSFYSHKIKKEGIQNFFPAMGSITPSAN